MSGTNPFIKIFGHPRSGTHYMNALLAKNFYPGVDMRRTGVSGHWADRGPTKRVDNCGLIGGNAFYRRNNRSNSNSVYVFRDGRDVALSLWRTKSMMHPDWRELPLREYLRRQLDWEQSCGLRAKVGSNFTIAEHWVYHLSSWLEHQYRILMVRFEDVVRHPILTLKNVASFFDFEYGSLEPVTELVGHSPNEGRVGRWRDFFSDEDNAFFLSHVPGDFFGLDER